MVKYSCYCYSGEGLRGSIPNITKSYNYLDCLPHLGVLVNLANIKRSKAGPKFIKYNQQNQPPAEELRNHT